MTINKFGYIDEHKTFTIITNVSDNLDRKDFFEMAEEGKPIAKVPLSWKHSISQGVVVPNEKKKCGELKKNLLCDNCDKLVNQRKMFSANRKEFKKTSSY